MSFDFLAMHVATRLVSLLHALPMLCHLAARSSMGPYQTIKASQLTNLCHCVGTGLPANRMTVRRCPNYLQLNADHNSTCCSRGFTVCNALHSYHFHLCLLVSVLLAEHFLNKRLFCYLMLLALSENFQRELAEQADSVGYDTFRSFFGKEIDSDRWQRLFDAVPVTAAGLCFRLEGWTSDNLRQHLSDGASQRQLTRDVWNSSSRHVHHFSPKS